MRARCQRACVPTVMVMQVGVVARRLRLPDDDEPAVGRAQHLDRRAVQPRQRLGRDHLFAASPATAPPRAEVHDAVEVGEDRVHVVGDDHHGRRCPRGRSRRPARPRSPGSAGRGCRAARRAAAAAGGAPAPARSAAAAARRRSTRPIGRSRVRLGADERRSARRPAAPLAPAARAPATGRPSGRRRARAARCRRRGCAATGRSSAVAAGSRSRRSRRPAGGRARSTSPAASGTSRGSPSAASTSRRRSARAPRRTRRRGRRGRRRARPCGRRDRRAPTANRHRARHDALAGASASSSARSSRTCHAWNVAVSGTSVSVIGRDGMCATARGVDQALHVGRRVLAVVDEHLDLACCDLRVDRRLVGAVGSLPSATASRNDSGVTQLEAERRRPTSDTMLSDAPIGVPANRCLISRDQAVVVAASPTTRDDRARVAAYPARCAGSTRPRSAVTCVDECADVGAASTTGADCRRRERRAARRRRARRGRDRVGVEQLLRPRVVADAVLDHELRRRNRPRVARRSARSRAGRRRGCVTMLVTSASGPASCSAMLPQKFSADDAPGSARRQSRHGRRRVEHAASPRRDAQPDEHHGRRPRLLRMILISARYGRLARMVKNGNHTHLGSVCWPDRRPPTCSTRRLRPGSPTATAATPGARRDLIEALAAAGRPSPSTRSSSAPPASARAASTATSRCSRPKASSAGMAGVGDFARFELTEALVGHHHHLACQECGAMTDVHLPPRARAAARRGAQRTRRRRGIRAELARARRGRGMRVPAARAPLGTRPATMTPATTDDVPM